MDSAQVKVPMMTAIPHDKGRCFMCLKEPREDESPSFLLAERITNFEPLLCYLMGISQEDLNKSIAAGEGDLLKKLQDVPPLCIGCFDILKELYDLHQNLVGMQQRIQYQTCIARSVIKRSSHHIEGGADEGDDQKGMNFALEMVRQQIVQNYKAPVQFQRQLPLEDIISPESPTDGIQTYDAISTVTSSASGVISGELGNQAAAGMVLLLAVNNEMGGEPRISTVDPMSAYDGNQTGNEILVPIMLRPHPPMDHNMETAVTMDSDGNVAGEVEILDEFTRGMIEGDALGRQLMGGKRFKMNHNDQTQVTYTTTKPPNLNGVVDPCGGGGGTGGLGLSIDGIPVSLHQQHHASLANYMVLHGSGNGISKPMDLTTQAMLLHQMQMTPSSLASPPQRTEIPSVPKPSVIVSLDSATPILQYPESLTLPSSEHLAPSQLCDVCSAEVPQQEMLAHLQNHVGPQYVFHCSDCKHTFLTPFRLYTFHKGLPVKCPTYNPSNFLQKHLQCDRCNFQAENIYNFKLHLSNHEAGPTGEPDGLTSREPICCPLCPQSYYLRSSVLIHLQEHHVFQNINTSHPCDVCGKYQDGNQMEGHMSSHNITPDMLLRCKICPAKFSSLEGLIMHQDKANRLSIHHMCCHLCNFKPSGENTGDLEIHYMEQHQMGRKYMCGGCSQEFLTVETCKAHALNCGLQPGAVAPEQQTRTVAPEQQTPAVAPEEIEPTPPPPPVTPHEPPKMLPPKKKQKPKKKKKPLPPKDTNKPPEPVKQNSNGVAVADPAPVPVLQLEKKKKRKCNQIYECSECQKPIVSKAGLDCHMLIHTGERPFSCGICAQRFRHKSSLAQHQKSHVQMGAKFKPKGEQERKKK